MRIVLPGWQCFVLRPLSWFISPVEAVLGEEVKKIALDQVLSIGRASTLRPDEGVERRAIFRAQTLQGLGCSGCLMPRCDQDFGPLFETSLGPAMPGCRRRRAHLSRISS